MLGMDISNYQKNIDFTKGNYDFSIIKATEGVGFTDKSFHNFSVQLTKMNKLIGCYHFARPDLNKTLAGMEREADWFIETVESEGLLHKSILVLDWETEPMDREDLIQAWVLRVESQTGVTPWIYGSKSKLKKWKDYWPVNHCPIWMAAWPSIKPINVGDELNISLPDQSVPWQIWQYSSTGKYPGFSGNVDLDYTGLTKEEWLKSASGKEAEEVISDDMQWAIDNGLFAGYGNGLYGPKDPLTREQAATLLRAYTRQFIV